MTLAGLIPLASILVRDTGNTVGRLAELAFGPPRLVSFILLTAGIGTGVSYSLLAWFEPKHRSLYRILAACAWLEVVAVVLAWPHPVASAGF